MSSRYVEDVNLDPAPLPDWIEGSGGLLLRRWSRDDAAALGQAIAESAEHLRPWMAWIADEPVALERRRARIDEWNRGWTHGGDVYLGFFLEGRIVGGGGLHRRLGSDGLELGYWIHAGRIRRGLATQAAALLTGAALALPAIDHVEIHHDKANVASAGVPRKLGFELIREAPDLPEAPAEFGVELQWRMDKQRWAARTREDGL